jgi:hypothetical protein
MPTFFANSVLSNEAATTQIKKESAEKDPSVALLFSFEVVRYNRSVSCCKGLLWNSGVARLVKVEALNLIASKIGYIAMGSGPSYQCVTGI